MVVVTFLKNGGADRGCVAGHKSNPYSRKRQMFHLSANALGETCHPCIRGAVAGAGGDGKLAAAEVTSLALLTACTALGPECCEVAAEAVYSCLGDESVRRTLRVCRRCDEKRRVHPVAAALDSPLGLVGEEEAGLSEVARPGSQNHHHHQYVDSRGFFDDHLDQQSLHAWDLWDLSFPPSDRLRYRGKGDPCAGSVDPAHHSTLAFPHWDPGLGNWRRRSRWPASSLVPFLMAGSGSR